MVEVQGTCAPEFEAVQAAFADNFEQGNELGASACVTLHGEPVDGLELTRQIKKLDLPLAPPV